MKSLFSQPIRTIIKATIVDCTIIIFAINSPIVIKVTIIIFATNSLHSNEADNIFTINNYFYNDPAG